IAAFAALDPAGFMAATSAASYIFGGIGYAFIIAMLATSFDRTAGAIGPRLWRILHMTGGYYLWLQFMVSLGQRVPAMPLYALFLIPLLAVIAARLMAMATTRSARGVDLTPAALRLSAVKIARPQEAQCSAPPSAGRH